MKTIDIPGWLACSLCCLLAACKPDNSAVTARRIDLYCSMNEFGTHAGVGQTCDLNGTPEKLEGVQAGFFENGNRLFELSDAGAWQDDYLPKAGHIYRLEAHVPGYPPAWIEAKAPSVVPFEVTGVRLDSIDRGMYSDHVLILKIAINDPPGEQNFYRLLADVIDHTGVSGYFPQPDPVFDRYSSPFNKTSIWSDFCFTDKTFDGQRYVIDYYFSVSEEFGNEPVDLRFAIRLESLNHQLYWYQRTIHLQGLQLTDPFSEPVQVYSDAVNGLGCLTISYPVSDTVTCRYSGNGQWNVE